MMGRLTAFIAHALPPAEREAVLGDLFESNQPAHRAFRDVLGLVFRRATSSLLILPLALLLILLARDTADVVAIYLWLWTSNLDAHLLTNAGFWHGVAESAPRLLLTCLSLALFSWSAATLAARLSRATAMVFCTALLIAAPFAPDLGSARTFHGNDAVFHSAFYRLAFPCLMQCVFVLLPALIAIRHPRMETAS
jgi:hypothetical protein